MDEENVLEKFSVWKLLELLDQLCTLKRASLIYETNVLKITAISKIKSILRNMVCCLCRLANKFQTDARKDGQ